MKFLVLLLILSVTWACSKEEPASALVGTWRLTTYCKPTSTTACTSVTVPADKNVFIVFTSDGRFIETYENTKPVEYGFLGGNGSYQIEGDSVRIVTLLMSSMSGMLIPMISVKGNQLVLKPYGTGEYVFDRIN